jgi:tetratricopeptide (TPR) repeat protein
MGRTFCRERFLAPLLLLIFTGAAAAPGADVLYRQAQDAFSSGKVSEAGLRAANALKQLGDSDDDLAWRLRILYGDTLISGGKSMDARNVLQRPLPAKLAGTDIEILRLRGLAVAAKRLRDDRAGDELIRQAYKLAEKQPRTLPSVLLVLATYDEKKRDQWVREALRLSRKYGDVRSEIAARGTMGFHLANDGRFDEAIGLWEPLLKKARTLGNESTIQKFEGNLGWAYLELGDYETANAFFTSAIAKAKQLGAGNDLVPWTYQLGNVLLHNGDLDGAQKQYRAAYELAEKTKHAQKGTTLVYLANASLLAGRLTDAHQYANAAFEERKKEQSPEPALR